MQTEADIEYDKNVTTQLKSFHFKETELSLWLQNNSYFHPDHESKTRELNNVRWKIMQLTNRKQHDS